ncbi:uroporphyrinogen-III C-methyltransferase [Shewanella psychrophila]|uniref:uroporphyrinogen-III C-methyltransferase n=1 Tax=Shewanella psychrophila TaxID=225848 RepID=A0A1S6HML7_9GAMM|nr:uroporphyrinogen-III C-methyltransferase [Shewanella psychrophila]AQS36760.1 uroporphyrinogen-III C-methyltransferase [Shewanella psychrophila]
MESADIIELKHSNNVNLGDISPSHRVAIVGSGCGDAELLTLKAARLISAADAIIYDSLVSEDILELASKECEMHFAGKRCGMPSAKQDDINQLLVICAKRGLKVVRLKGGDPNVFGRGCEEALFLAKNGIASHFVPGVTAALGCAASAGIPLTHRGVARSVTMVTGTVVEGASKNGVHWQALISIKSTLVFYMGKEQASQIAHSLLSAGANIELPMVFISSGARCEQKLTFAELGTMTEVAKQLEVSGPTLMIVGEVVNVGQELAELLCQFEPHKNDIFTDKVLFESA